MSQRAPLRHSKTSLQMTRLTVVPHLRFPLSSRNLEDPLNERGVEVSHETVRFRWNRFGPLFSA